MLAIKYLLEALGVVMMGGAAAVLILQILQNRRSGDPALPAALPVLGLTPEQRNTAAAGLLGLIPLLIGLSMTVVPAGMVGVRVSQWSGTLPGTLYPGFHLLVPLVHKVELYDARDRVYHTVAAETKEKPGEVLQVQTREGLLVGLAASVRYRVDPSKLDFIHAALPHPLDSSPTTCCAAFPSGPSCRFRSRKRPAVSDERAAVSQGDRRRLAFADR